MSAPAPIPAPRLAVLVSGPTEAVVRRVLACHVKPHFHMQKNQWRARYRDDYSLVVLSRPLRAGQDAAAVYGPHAGAMALVVAALDENAPGSGFAATRDWLKAQGFNPVAWVPLTPGGPESTNIGLGMDVVRFISLGCPWRSEAIEDIDAYQARSKPLW